MCQPGLVFAKSNPPQLIENQVVEAACGECQFHLKGKGCNLAVRINGKAYFVDGTGIDEHGDAHASDGFCTTIRKARVSGQIVNGRFQASSFELLPFSGASY
ncbi:MAG: hypothetical protein COV45_02705 [Deltaproteobacteria bacterium CG11_big_fil_rev_8_21_14_0_20_47_16]|nr:MAG: hypothetical protein COV45_02705 [Deltaproteobacteria bacterium CG11_big_fil_rev_8_21_14_0_20_47_16]